MNLKNNKGFAGVDVAVATVIFIVFVSLVASLFYNTANTSKKIQRKATATNLCIEIIEALKASNFDDLADTTEDNPMTIETLNSISGRNIEIPDGYNQQIHIEDTIGDNLVKVLKVTVSYQQKNNVEDVMIETLVKNI